MESTANVLKMNFKKTERISVGAKVKVRGTNLKGKVISIGKKGMVLLNIKDMKLFTRTVYAESELEII